MTQAISKKHTPIRTCLNCRARKAKKELIRIVKKDDVELEDKNHIISARAYYYCNQDCRAKHTTKQSKGKRR